MSSVRQRTRRFARKLGSSPVLPLLGWTKVVEAIVAGGPLVNWVGYAVACTIVWVFADALQEAADDVVNEATD